MVTFEKIEDLAGEKRSEYLESKLAKQEALLDYVALMSDIDIPKENDDGNPGNTL